MNEFIGEGWQAILEHNDLGGFEALWNLQADWFEPPNQRRGGWSGVSRIHLRTPSGGEETIFLKRQENHTRKTWRHPLSGEPTFRGEASNLRRLNSSGVAAPQLVYYAEQPSPKGWRVILATRELHGYLPLDELVQNWREQGWAGFRGQRRKIIPQIAKVIRKLHALRLAHNALHAKHVFIHQPSGGACLIDLEKMRRRISRHKAVLRDLDTLNRRTAAFSRTDRLRFLLAYLQREKADAEVRALWQQLVVLEKRKNT